MDPETLALLMERVSCAPAVSMSLGDADWVLPHLEAHLRDAGCTVLSPTRDAKALARARGEADAVLVTSSSDDSVPFDVLSAGLMRPNRKGPVVIILQSRFGASDAEWLDRLRGRIDILDLSAAFAMIEQENEGGT